MHRRRWWFGVTVVVAVGMGGVPAAAQQSPPASELPKVEVPAVTVPPVEVPVPGGGPAISTPAISTPAVSTPPVRTPTIVTPVGTVPSVTVPSVKVAPVTASPVRTVPASPGGEKPATGGGPSASPPTGDPAGPAERRATPAVAVRGTSARHDDAQAPPAARAPDTAEAADPHSAPARHAAEPVDPHPASSPGERRASPAEPIVRARVDRRTAPAVEAAPVKLPAANAADRRPAEATRPLIDGLGDAFDLVPLLIALAFGGVLCVVSVRLRRTS
jgi:hypothetical protein